MDAPTPRWGALQSRWPLLLALLLALYSAVLLGVADAGSRQRLAETNAWLVGDSQRRAQTLADALAEIHAMAQAHAELPEIRAYLANRDLGMSPRYGLNAARGAIDAALRQRAEEGGRRWGVRPPRIVVYTAAVEVLVDTASQDGPPPPPVLPQHAQGLRIDVARGTLEHVVPVLHKGQADGALVMTTPLAALQRKLLAPGPGEQTGHHELLLALDGRLPPGSAQHLPFDPGQLQRLAGAADDRVIDTAALLDSAGLPPLLDGTLLIKTRVPQAPLLLVTFTPQAMAHGHLPTRTLTIAGGLLLALMVAGAFKLDGMRRQAAQLTEEVAAAERQRALTEFRNRELTAEIERRQAAERALADSEQRWQLAVAGTNDGVWDWNPGTGELFMSERWLAMIGYAPGELPAHVDAWRGLLHADDVAVTMARLQDHLAGRTPFYEAEFRLLCRGGGWRWVLGRGKAQFDAQGRPVRMAGSHTDITERREAEARLRDHTEQLGAVFELSPDGFVTFDAQRCVRFVSSAFEALTGVPEAEVLGLDEAVFATRMAARGLPGQVFPGSPGLPGAGAEAGPQPGGRSVFRLAGPPVRVLEVGVRQAASANVSQVMTLRDITRETEIDRMKSEFLTTAAHELRTPMTSIYGFVGLLRMREMDSAKRRSLLDTVARQSELMMAIINQLLDLARIEARQGSDFVLEHTLLQDVVGATVADHRPADGRPPPAIRDELMPLPVQVDRQKLQQALLNILSNAYKYSDPGSEVMLRYRAEAGPAGLRHGVSVRDQGIGMTPEQVAHVCERFYRADASGNIPGTGLGMSIVQEIAGLHRGEVQIDSAPGQGTEVTLWLPAAACA